MAITGAWKLTTLAQINLTSAGTRQAISATPLLSPCVIVSAAHANSGNIYVGDASVSATRYAAVLAAKSSYTFTGPDINGCTRDIDLSTIYIDGATTNDDVQVAYLERI
jgi:hypothetical protein